MKLETGDESGDCATDNFLTGKGRPIMVWRFSEAPKEYQRLSPHGGDEDWVAFVPKKLAGEWIGWLEEGTSFGCAEVSEHAVPGGVVRIGAHS